MTAPTASRATAPSPGAPSADASTLAGRPRRSDQLSTVLVAAGTVAAVIIGVALTPGFVTTDNVLAILRNASVVGIVAVAMTPMTLSGNFVSLGTQQSAMAASVVFVGLVGKDWPPAAAIMLVLGALVLVGVAQGMIVAAGLNPVITTLAAGAIVFGVVVRVTNGTVVSVGSHPVSWGDGTVLGIPIEVLLFAAFTIGVGLIIGRTVIGREITLSGASHAAAVASGISFRRVTVAAFVIFSVGLAVAGVLTGAGFGEASSDSLNTLTIDALAAILVGGTAITGGYGSPWRSAGGSILIAVIVNITILNGFGTGSRLTVEGGVVVGTVTLLAYVRRRRGTR